MRKSNLALLMPVAAAAACAPMSGTGSMSYMQLTGEPAATAPPLLEAGTTIRVQFDRALGPAAIRSPDRFVASVVEPVRSESGAVVVPAGATIHFAVVDSEGTLPPPHVLIGLRPERLEIDGVMFPFESAVIDVEVAHPSHHPAATAPTQARFGTPESMVPGAIIVDAMDFLKENELGPDPGTVISVGTTMESALPRGTQIVLQVSEAAPLYASIPRAGG